MKQVSAFVRRAECHRTPLRRAVGPVAMLAMRIAWAAAFIAVIVCVLGGVIAVIRGAWFGGALLIFIFAPVGYGQHVALGMAIRYAEGEN